jgi:hypothetical protein
MLCSRRVVAVCLFCFSPLLLGQAAQGPTNPLDNLDNNFMKTYDARTGVVRATNPPFIEVSGGSLFLHLHGQDAIKVRVLTDPYHHLKDVAHIPFTIYLLLYDRGNAQLSDEQLGPIHDLQVQLTAAQEALASEGFEPVQLDRQRQIFDASTRLIEVVLENRTVDQGMLKTYARTMAPLMLKNADEAGCFQVQATHKQILAWKPMFTQQDWKNLHVVIKNSHQPRYREASTQYFAWLLGGSSPTWALPGETNRVIYVEALFGKQTAEDELLDVLVDFEASRFFFGNEWRMTEDILSDGAANCIASLPNEDRSFNSTSGVSK